LATIIPNISVIIITKNSADFIRRCLDSVRWAQELIILDSGSTDNTGEICREYTEHVYLTDWPGFGIQKNRALAKATGDWVFSIDSDEWVSEALQEEILQTIAHAPQYDAFSIPRRNQYLGTWVDHGDVGRDRVTRLFKRKCAQFTDDVVHESLVVQDGKIGNLKHSILHISYRTVEELLERMNYYTTLSADMRFAKGKKSSLSKAISHAVWAFFKAYILRLGFLDGRIGFIVAVSSAESSYYRYLKLLYHPHET